MDSRAEARNLPRHRSPSLLPCLLLSLLLGGCTKAHIVRFTTSPAVACPGDTVTLSWETNGAVHLQATPEISELNGRRDRTGQQAVTVQGATRFRLETSRLFGKTELTEQDVLTPSQELEFGVDDTQGATPFLCQDPATALEATLSLEDRHLSPNLRVDQVINMNPRPLTIHKGEVSETVNEGAPAPSLQGQFAHGPWRLSVPLGPDERCEDALESVFGRLILKLQLSCPR